MLLRLILTPNLWELCNFDPSGRDRGGDRQTVQRFLIILGKGIRLGNTLPSTRHKLNGNMNKQRIETFNKEAALR